MSKTVKRAAQEVPAEPEPVREPTHGERLAIAAAIASNRNRPEPLSYKVEGADGRDMRVDIPHSDRGGFEVLRRATFGTASYDFATSQTSYIGAVVRERGRTTPTEMELNNSIAAVAGIAPQNEMEAMLAVQMVGTHDVAMTMLNRAKQADTTDKLERFGSLATKMLRTYTAQIEALAKLRRGGEQKVRVEHVHVYSGGQAIVGQAMHTGGRVGGALENGKQPHAHLGNVITGAAALALEDGASMLRQDTGRNGVSVASGPRQEPVPDARRSQGKRRTKG